MESIFKNPQIQQDEEFNQNFIILFNFLTPNRVDSHTFSMSDSFQISNILNNSPIRIPEIVLNASPQFWKFYVDNIYNINKIIQTEKSKQKNDEESFLFKIKLFIEYPEFIEFKYRFDDFRKRIKNKLSISGFKFKIDPDNILETSYNVLAFEEISNWLSTFRISYINNIGVDLGGLTKDWMTKLSKEFTNPKCFLFDSTDKNMSFQPNPLSKYKIPNYKNYFKFAGMFIARCIIQQVCVNVHFTRAFLKQILHRRIRFEDLESVDDEKFNSLNFYLQNDLDNYPEFYFEVDKIENDKIETIELKENGSDIRVNNSNKEEYVQLMAKFYLVDLIHEQIDSFVEGFNSLIPHDEIKHFTPNELNLIICGVPKIDIDDFRENVYCSDKDGLNMFFNVISKWNDEDLAKLLMFITGTSRVPSIGFRYFSEIGKTIKIGFTNNISHMPVAHTCFNELVLPKYLNEETMNQKLRYAMNECDSFQVA